MMLLVSGTPVHTALRAVKSEVRPIFPISMIIGEVAWTVADDPSLGLRAWSLASVAILMWSWWVDDDYDDRWTRRRDWLKNSLRVWGVQPQGSVV